MFILWLKPYLYIFLIKSSSPIHFIHFYINIVVPTSHLQFFYSHYIYLHNLNIIVWWWCWPGWWVWMTWRLWGRGWNAASARFLAFALSSLSLMTRTVLPPLLLVGWSGEIFPIIYKNFYQLLTAQFKSQSYVINW